MASALPTLPPSTVNAAYAAAQKRYAALGVDVEAALAALDTVPVSLHCWQGDDVRGFEKAADLSGSGLAATGNYPGAARTGDELRADAATAFSMIPGPVRFNLHAIYAETDGERVGRDQLEPRHFKRWMEWAKKLGVRLDFNTSFFAHPMAASGFTLSHEDPKIAGFWLRHGLACRKIAEAMGRAQKAPCVINHWLPDGAKDSPADRWAPRRRLAAQLDKLFALKLDKRFCLDAVEGKLFGIGSEDFVVGSHEFYLSYTASRQNALLCLDMGHFHPTETIHDKISAILTFQKQLLLHVSRGIRWDSDHVVLFNDDTRAVFQELARGNALGRACIALDYFDASLNRVGAWVIGARATRKALLAALLEPAALIRSAAARGDQASKLALLEEAKTLPFGAVWDAYCQRHGIAAGSAWLNTLAAYEKKVQSKRA
ncbi:MAG: L-rhamnose isomerase [Lentisphaeria bacterium]